MGIGLSITQTAQGYSIGQHNIMSEKPRLQSIKNKVSTIIDTRMPLHNHIVERVRGREGQRRRECVLVRDNYLCQQCKRDGRVTIAKEVDHVVPLHLGGGDNEENRQSLCIECHVEKSKREMRSINNKY